MWRYLIVNYRHRYRIDMYDYNIGEINYTIPEEQEWIRQEYVKLMSDTLSTCLNVEVEDREGWDIKLLDRTYER